MMARSVAISNAVIGLDRWFDSMRVDFPTPGYGGQVVHWWNHCLAYRGSGLDWRYEGIIDGYLTLWQRCGDRRWLDKACRAGDDLLGGQLHDGRFVNSQFELNPGDGGTPHEAAADVGLLLLARTLREAEDPAADRYLAGAQRNLEWYWLGQLWHEDTGTLWDSPNTPSFVPNKAATFIEAMLLLAELTADQTVIAKYAIPTAEHILKMQVDRPGGGLNGAIAQNRFGDRVVESYFPLYIARCIPALLQLTSETGDDRYQSAAQKAATFVVRVRESDGGLPQVLYSNRRINRNPRWIAGAGDVVRALDLAAESGAEVDSAPTIDWILRGVRDDGRIATADGFGRILPILSRRDRFADELGVVGWADKAFRALTRYADPNMTRPCITIQPALQDRSRREFHGVVR
jgi:hypothetical protein